MPLELGKCGDIGCERIVTKVSPEKNIEVIGSDGLTFFCCPETINGAICEDIPSNNPDFCKFTLRPTTCDKTSDCVVGCCYDSKEGLCIPKSTKKKCEDSGGEWHSNEDCNPSEVSKCQKGCCILGNNTEFITETRCEKLSLERGYEKEFLLGLSEIDCFSKKQDDTQKIFSNVKNCTDEKGEIRRHGESWCFYESYIGDGKDPVGSGHWKRSCINGEIITDYCGDYRGRICAQSEIIENGETFSLANCVINEASLCLEYNKEENKSIMQEKCNSNEHCIIKNIDIDSNFKFDVCVPQYPKGFSLEESEKNNNLCSGADMTCTVIYKKDLKGSYHCKKNCDCLTEEFAEKMNDFCISLGDCGTYINYIGEGTNNIQVKKSKEVSWEDYTTYKEPIDGKYVNHQDLNRSLGLLSGSNFLSGDKKDGFIKTMDSIGQVAGISGSIITGINFLTKGAITDFFSSGFLFKEGISGASTNLAGAFTGATMGASIGIMLAGYLNKKFGISGDASKVMLLAGGVTGLSVGYMIGANAWSALAGYTSIVGLCVMAYIVIVGWGKTKKVNVEFYCKEWQPPLGSENCEKCNEDDSFKDCTKYRCESLGTACKLVNENTENPICIGINYEQNPPIISFGNFFNYSSQNQIIDDYIFKNPQEKSVKIIGKDYDCITERTKMLFSLETDEYSRCRYDFEDKGTYEDFSGYAVEQNSFSRNHSFRIELPSLKDLDPNDVKGNLKEKFADINIYIKCQDYHGNFNIAPYILRLCIKSEIDTTPAVISYFKPKDNSILKFGSNKTVLEAHLKDEPAECRYDIIPGKNYEDMNYKMSCDFDVNYTPINGWVCTTVLNNLTAGENKFYFKCKDKPWVKTPEDIEEYGERNVNKEDIIYSIFVSERELKIEDLSPSGIIENSVEPISVDLGIKTSGGSENGKSICYYNWGGDWIYFQYTDSDIHKQEGLNLIEGKYNIPIKCEDSSGNIIEDNIIFELKIDKYPPQVTRVYKEGSSLIIITNEEAECFSGFKSCNFYINDTGVVDMTTVLSEKHSIEWKTGRVYYIKCKDSFGNLNPECAVKIKAQ